MSTHPDAHALQRRREQLLMRSAALRVRLRHDAQVLEAPFALVDQGRHAMRWLRANPEWPLAAIVHAHYFEMVRFAAGATIGTGRLAMGLA